MLLPLTHAAVPHHSTASTEPQQSKPTPYDPPQTCNWAYRISERIYCLKKVM